jgi:hypothetical protein
LVVRNGHFDFRSAANECRKNIIRVCGLGQEIHRPKPDRIDSGCNAPEPRQDQNLNIFVDGFQVCDHAQAGSPRHAKIYHGEVGWSGPKNFDRFIACPRNRNSKASLLKRFGQSITQNKAIINQQDTLEIMIENC